MNGLASPEKLHLRDYDYRLPKEKIAQFPLPERGGSRLLVLDRVTGAIEHRWFADLDRYVSSGDLLVVNETRVIPARLKGTKVGTGARLEVFLLRDLGNDRWETLIKPQRRVRSGIIIDFGEGVQAEVDEWVGEGKFRIRLLSGPLPEQVLDRLGDVPLPPYIRRDPVPEDRDRYQTVFAAEPGAVAAPTAGLHFTREHLARLTAGGVGLEKILLHTGLGTFRPIKVEDVTLHRMEAEYFEVSDSLVRRVGECRDGGGRVFAVGTTTTRALESAARWNGADSLRPAKGWTDRFIHPPYEFRVVDALITNFHQPKSTLLLLVSALAGRDRIMRAYHEALEMDYRFLSYGDAMLIQ